MFWPRDLLSWLSVLFFAVTSQRDRITICVRDLLQISIFRAVDGFNDLDGNRLANGLREIRPCYANLGKPSRRIAFELPVLDLPVITLDVHINDDMRIDPVHLGNGPFEWDPRFHIENRRTSIVRQEQSGQEENNV